MDARRLLLFLMPVVALSGCTSPYHTEFEAANCTGASANLVLILDGDFPAGDYEAMLEVAPGAWNRTPIEAVNGDYDVIVTWNGTKHVSRIQFPDDAGGAIITVYLTAAGLTFQYPPRDTCNDCFAFLTGDLAYERPPGRCGPTETP